MKGTSTNAEALYQERLNRLHTAVALGTPDRVPVFPNGPAWPARALGVKMWEQATDPDVRSRTISEAYMGLGGCSVALILAWTLKVRRCGALPGSV